MAHYLLRAALDDEYQIIKADSAKDAATKRNLSDGTVEVWTLRSDKPRIFEVSTESVRTVKRAE